MKTFTTIKIKLPQKEVLLETMKQYSYSSQRVIDFGWNIQTDDKGELHDLTYQKIRKETDLPAQLVCSSRDKAVEVLKAKPKSRPIMRKFLTIRYDARSFTFKSDKEGYYISLSTINGRTKIPIEIPEYYWKYLDWKACSADLILNKKTLFIHIKLSRNYISFPSNKTLGIDVGINNIAVTSNKRFFNANQIKKKKLMFKRLRAKFQSKGTRSSKRRLRTLSGRENHWMAWVNHNISKQIADCEEGNIIMENIKGIRRKSRGRRLNYWLHSWNFYQLQNFIEYKAIRKGKNIIRVNPNMTSKTCSKCGNIGSRSKSFFKCSHCGYTLNADLNASFNLAKHGSKPDHVLADVNQPNVSDDEAKTFSSGLKPSSETINHKANAPQLAAVGIGFI